MTKNLSLVALAATAVLAGCVEPSDPRPSAPSEIDATADALAGAMPMSCSDPMVHPSQPAGDIVVLRDDSYSIASITPISLPGHCAVMGVFELVGGSWGTQFREVMADDTLSAAFPAQPIDCASCLAFYGEPPGGAGLPPEGLPDQSSGCPDPQGQGGGAEFYGSMSGLTYGLRTTSEVVTHFIGTLGGAPNSYYHVGTTYSDYSSFCHNPLGPNGWGELRNYDGRDLLSSTICEYGHDVFQMSDGTRKALANVQHVTGSTYTIQSVYPRTPDPCIYTTP